MEKEKIQILSEDKPTLCFISQTVLYSSFKLSGIVATPWMDPPAAIISFFKSSLHKPISVRSYNRKKNQDDSMSIFSITSDEQVLRDRTDLIPWNTLFYQKKRYPKKKKKSQTIFKILASTVTGHELADSDQWKNEAKGISTSPK